MFPFKLPAGLATHALLLTLAFAACKRESKSNALSAKAEAAKLPQAIPLELWSEFSGQRALEHARLQVECGPRAAGSPELARARERIVSALQASGWNTELQEFTPPTPNGPVRMVNVVARFPSEPGNRAGLASQKVIVASHYDTKLFRTISFVGANDGASSTGALLELARVLAMDPPLAAQVELVFFDGEEAVQQFTETDGLYGSRYYATQLRDSGRATQFKCAIVWDMIGDKDLTITLPIDSPRALTVGMLASAEKLNCKNAFRIFERPMLDDHVPLNQIARIPALDVIDFEYAPWHTADDTLDKLSASSLQTIGSVTLHYLKQ
ncbi:MAG: M28 family peptidase, partial [Verrucomicrobia bacterium]|nr:M28 family peptidase [Verrucomicrobiota bacterium]